ncbi:MAG: hypothetical protein AMXMBFR7_19270 [Planctomycetota bacterium]
MPAAVRSYETTFSIPGYAPEPAEKVPLYQVESYTRIYPYPLRDHLSFKKETLQVRARCLENEHLKLTVTPCYGGHIWSLYDKARKREVFYTPDVFKPGLIRLPGAWMPLGLEFNFPNGHTPMSLSPVASTARTHADGSASIVVGDLELISRMRWQVELILRPGVAALDVRTRLANPTPLAHRWYFWANAGVDTSDGWQFSIPAKCGRIPWTGEKRDYPMHNGRDQSRYTSYRGPDEFFGAGVAEDFFGCYNHDTGAGIVHVADWRKMKGKKFFTWGSAPEGKVWGRMFCDKPVRHYVEIQCGPLETQADREWFPPFGERHWNERWYPVDRTGLFFYANHDLAFGLAGEARRRALTVFPCEDLGACVVEIKQGAKRTRKEANLKAGRLFKLPAPGAEPFEASVRNAAGRVVAQARYPYVPRQEPGTLARLKRQQARTKRFEEAPATFEDRLERIDHHLLNGERTRARRLIEEAVRERSQDPQARLLRGRYFLDQGLWGRAEVDLKAVVSGSSRAHAAQAYDLLGVVARYREALDLASESFKHAAAFAAAGSAEWARAEQALAEIELAQNLAPRARTRLALLCEDPAHATAQRRTLLALARRMQGDYWGALSSVEAALRTDPLYLPARWERWAAHHFGKLAAMPAQLDEIHALHESGDYPSADREMEVAWWYLGMGQHGMALTVLSASKLQDPRADYLAAYITAHSPAAPKAWVAKHLDRAAALRADYAFPFRLEELALFNWATRERPRDAQAWRLRGTLMGSLFRHEEALSDFQKAVKLEPGDALAWRNISLSLTLLKRPLRQAAAACERAYAAAPGDPDIACELLGLYERMGDTAKRVALYRGANAALKANHRFLKRGIGIFVEAGRFADAVKLVESRPFVRWEGEVSPHESYAFSCLQLGRDALARRRFAEAVQWFERAGTYPPTTFSVRPSRPTDSAWRYWKGVALEASGDEKKARAEYRKAADEQDWDNWYWISTEAPLWRALARRRLGREDEARADLEKVIELCKRKELFYGQSPTIAVYATALANLALGRKDDAIKGLERVLQEGGLRFRARPWIADLKAVRKGQPFRWPHERCV